MPTAPYTCIIFVSKTWTIGNPDKIRHTRLQPNNSEKSFPSMDHPHTPLETYIYIDLYNMQSKKKKKLKEQKKQNKNIKDQCLEVSPLRRILWAKGERGRFVFPLHPSAALALVLFRRTLFRGMSVHFELRPHSLPHPLFLSLPSSSKPLLFLL